MTIDTTYKKVIELLNTIPYIDEHTIVSDAVFVSPGGKIIEIRKNIVVMDVEEKDGGLYLNTYMYIDNGPIRTWDEDEIKYLLNELGGFES